MATLVSGVNSKLLFRMRARSPQGICTSSPRWELLFGEADAQIVSWGKPIVNRKISEIEIDTHAFFETRNAGSSVTENPPRCVEVEHITDRTNSGTPWTFAVGAARGIQISAGSLIKFQGGLATMNAVAKTRSDVELIKCKRGAI
jgi:hypothetical protein